MALNLFQEMWPKLNIEWMHSVAAGVNGITSIKEIVESDLILTNCKGIILEIT